MYDKGTTAEVPLQRQPDLYFDLPRSQNGCHKSRSQKASTRWFNVTFWSPSWRSLNHLKGHQITHPSKKGDKDLPGIKLHVFVSVLDGESLVFRKFASPEWCFTTTSRDVYMFRSDPINLFQSWFLNIRNLRKVISPTQIKVANRKSRIQNPRLVCLYKGWIPAQLYRDYFTSHEISIPSLTNQDFMFHVTIVG